MNLRPEAVPTLPLPPGIGIYIIHQPNDSEGTAQSHRNTQLSFPPPIESRAGSSGNPVLTRGIWIPAYAGMTIYSRCVDTYALRERPPGRVSATNCAYEPGGLSLTRPFGSPSPGGRGKVGAASGRRFMGRGFASMLILLGALVSVLAECLRIILVHFLHSSRVVTGDWKSVV